MTHHFNPFHHHPLCNHYEPSSLQRIGLWQSLLLEVNASRKPAADGKQHAKSGKIFEARIVLLSSHQSTNKHSGTAALPRIGIVRYSLSWDSARYEDGRCPSKHFSKWHGTITMMSRLPRKTPRRANTNKLNEHERLHNVFLHTVVYQQKT